MSVTFMPGGIGAVAYNVKERVEYYRTLAKDMGLMQ